MIIDIIISFIIFLLGLIIGSTFITYMYMKIGALDWSIVKQRQWNSLNKENKNDEEREG